MNPLGLVVLATSIWMAVDASRLGYDKRDIKGIAGMGPVGWFFCGLFLWIVAFPLYLIKRPELAAAGERRRLGGAPMPGALPYPQPPYPQQSYPQQPYPQQPYPQQPYPQPPAALTADEVAQWIVKLGEMHAAGLLTDAEFAQQKAQVLARMA
ncbi:MAG: SHOCT domain-containing protein [Myxococcales bacterium]|nr:SHOCT domain-containing protein [Myxococcales bacterium]